MEILTTPVASPGCCFQCGNAERQFYVDTGRSIDFHGAIYFCSECLAEMARAAGYIIPEEAATIRDDIQTALAEIKRLVAVNEGMEKALDGLFAARSNAGSYPLADVVVVDEPAAESISEGSEQLDFGEGTVVKPLHDEGVAELSDDAAPGDAGSFSLSI